MSKANQVALVTGASSGIGKAIAISLAEQGMAIWLVGRNRKELEAVVSSLGATGPRLQCVHADLEREEDIAKLAKRIKTKIGYLDILVNGAGYIRTGPVESADVLELDRHYRINVRAPYLLTQLMIPLLRLRQGQIVFLNSSAGRDARADVSQYAATKHALRALADSLRQEVNPDGIRVLSIYAGRTATAMQAVVHAMEGKQYQPHLLMQPEDIAKVVVSALALPRSAEVTEVDLRPMLKN